MTRNAHISETKLILRYPWLLPLLAAMVFLIASWIAISCLERELKRNLSGQLETILNADVEALQTWLHSQESKAKVLAADPYLTPWIEMLIAEAVEEKYASEALAKSKSLAKIREYLAPISATFDFSGFVITDIARWNVGSSQEMLTGQKSPMRWAGELARVVNGEVVLVTPFFPLKEIESGPGPYMFVSAPVSGSSGEIIAALSLLIRPEEDFTRILQIARSGESGETYAFNKEGTLISQSRFDKQLKEIGLLSSLPDSGLPDSGSVLQIEIRDPGGNMLNGFRPQESIQVRPLTKMAAHATTGKSGVDVDGYRDYRGVDVIGAWTWLPRYGFGVATEIDAAEAYRPVQILRTVTWTLIGLLALSAVVMFFSSHVICRLRSRIRRAEVKIRRLGQYTLDKKIGAGGFGEVYRASHEMLQRPTAVKFLKSDALSDKTLARFEREVQLTCKLTHPNTITIYDYGRTPEGTFYYAMEYLDGFALDEIVQRHGSLSEDRVIHVVRQMCASLREAHNRGLVHRDIKPANIMIGVIGDVPDVIKVLDFGLVKDTVHTEEFQLSGARELAGTPMFMAPEVFRRPRDVDARSDIYAIGVTAYYLLCGRYMFKADNYEQLIAFHHDQVPEPPSKHLGRQIAEDLEAIVLRCLEKDPGKRPQTAQDILTALNNCRDAWSWTEEKAMDWWTVHHPERMTTERSTGRAA